METNTTYNLVIGASEDPSRYSNMAIKNLLKHNHQVLALSPKKGEVNGIIFYTSQDDIIGKFNIDTITLYINPTIQKSYYQFIINIKPRRVIFNPGTENEELYYHLRANNIEVVIACTLVMLNTGQY